MGLTSSILANMLLRLPAALSHYHSPPADAAPTANLDALFQYTTSRNYKVISQAVDFVVSMQTAPTCTRMAASHLMTECKLLEHAPDFAKSRPEAYLDGIKTEYAAKLAVCEILSTQPPVHAKPPLQCEILVPSSEACRKRSWWSQAPRDSEKQCYPEYKEHQYSQCLKTLQSSPQYWTSFSNARQNAVVMCQASRDAIDRENHLEIFKNLTQVVSAVTSELKHTTGEYASLLYDQKQFADELHKFHTRFKKDFSAVQDKTLATFEDLDDKFHAFLETSISGLITALADGQSAEIVRIQKDMQVFSQDMISENAQLARSFSTELQQHHDRAIISLQLKHQAQMDSYAALAAEMSDIMSAADKINDTVTSSLTTISNIEHQLDSLSKKAQHIVRGFAFFSSLPQLVASLVRSLVVTVGAIFLLSLLYRLSRRLATSAAGACSAAYLLHVCGVYGFMAHLPTVISGLQGSSSWSDRITTLNATQKGVAIVVVLWLATYPVSRISAAINHTFTHIVSLYWVQQYSNDGGMGLLPSVEVPHVTMACNPDVLERRVGTNISYHNRQEVSAFVKS